MQREWKAVMSGNSKGQEAFGQGEGRDEDGLSGDRVFQLRLPLLCAALLSGCASVSCAADVAAGRGNRDNALLALIRCG